MALAAAILVTSVVGVTAPIAGPISGHGAGGTLEPAQRVAPPPRRATFAFTGDILTHRPVNFAAQQLDGTYDYSPMFARVAPLLSWADLAICHLEQPIAPPGAPVIVGPVIHSSAPSIATAVAGAGYRRCSTASNHSLDRGIAGIDATVAALLVAGVGQSGMARSPQEAIPEVLDVNGIAVAHLSYSYHLGGALPAAERWRANLIDPAAIVAAARDARARGAEVIVASLHWGASAHVAPTASQRSVAQAITASGEIDLIVGHHAHVVQPIERVNGTWVAWGLGNMISNMPFSFWPPSTQDGVVVTVAVTRDRTGAIEVGRPLVFPTWNDKFGGYVVWPTASARDPSLPPLLRIALAQSEARTRSVVGAFVSPG